MTSKWTVGQECVVVEDRRVHRAKVAKIGRKYLHVDVGNPNLAFAFNGGYRGPVYGCAPRLYTVAEYELKLKRDAAATALRDVLSRWHMLELSDDVLNEFAALAARVLP